MSQLQGFTGYFESFYANVIADGGQGEHWHHNEFTEQVEEADLETQDIEWLREAAFRIGSNYLLPDTDGGHQTVNPSLYRAIRSIVIAIESSCTVPIGPEQDDDGFDESALENLYREVFSDLAMVDEGRRTLREEQLEAFFRRGTDATRTPKSRIAPARDLAFRVGAEFFQATDHVFLLRCTEFIVRSIEQICMLPMSKSIFCRACADGRTGYARAMLNANGRLADCRLVPDHDFNGSGLTPLHFACLNADLYLVQLLLKRAPLCAQRLSSSSQATALHSSIDAALRRSGEVSDELSQIITLVLEAWPQAVNAVDRNGNTPFMHYALLSNLAINLTIARTLIGEGIRQSAGEGNNGEERSCTIIHKMIEKRCPLDSIECAISLDPDLALQRDERGDTPLLIASAAPKWKISPKIFQVLLSHGDSGRAAGMADAGGRLPLHVAASVGGTWAGGGYKTFTGCIELILEKAPRAVITRDMKTHMYPFMLAAVGNNSTLSTVFSLLKKEPSLAAPMATPVQSSPHEKVKRRKCN